MKEGILPAGKGSPTLERHSRRPNANNYQTDLQIFRLIVQWAPPAPQGQCPPARAGFSVPAMEVIAWSEMKEAFTNGQHKKGIPNPCSVMQLLTKGTSGALQSKLHLRRVSTEFRAGCSGVHLSLENLQEWGFQNLSGRCCTAQWAQQLCAVTPVSPVSPPAAARHISAQLSDSCSATSACCSHRLPQLFPKPCCCCCLLVALSSPSRALQNPNSS